MTDSPLNYEISGETVTFKLPKIADVFHLKGIKYFMLDNDTIVEISKEYKTQ